jgi:hypothetical protein
MKITEFKKFNENYKISKFNENSKKISINSKEVFVMKQLI